MSGDCVYLLMVDKRGWKSLERENVGLNTDYLRVNRYVYLQRGIKNENIST